jgi:hypothetical protein
VIEADLAAAASRDVAADVIEGGLTIDHAAVNAAVSTGGGAAAAAATSAARSVTMDFDSEFV